MVTINDLDDKKMHALYSFLMSVSKQDINKFENSQFIEAQALLDTLGLRGFANNVNGVYDDLKDRLPTSQERDAMFSIAERVANVSDSLLYIGSFFKDGDGNVETNHLRTFCYCVLVGIQLNAIRINPSKYQVLDFIVGTFAWKYVLGVKFSDIPEFFNQAILSVDIMSLFRTEPEPEAQMIDVSLDEFIDSVAASIASISIFKSISGKNKGSFIKDLSDIMRLKNGMSSFITNLVSLFDKIQAYLFETKLGGYAARMNSNGSHLIDIFIEDYEQVRLEVTQQKMYMSLENLARLTALIKQGERIYAGMTRTPSNANISTILMTNLNYLRKLASSFSEANLSLAGFRQESVTIVITGPPGVKKSHIAKHLGFVCVNIAKPALSFKQITSDPNAYMHTRQAENSFWDGYKGTESVVFFDDFGQMRDVAGNPDNEFMNFIRAMNSFEMHLHMSSIDNKGNCYFRSPFIVATTNVKNFRPKSIISTEALERRFDFFIELEIRPQYRARTERGYGFNSRVPRDAHGELEICPELFLYNKLEKNSSDEYQIANTFNYGGLIQEIRKLFKIKQYRFETHERLFASTLAKYGEFETPEEAKRQDIIVMESLPDTFDKPCAEMNDIEYSDLESEVSSSDSSNTIHYPIFSSSDSFTDSDDDDVGYETADDVIEAQMVNNNPPLRPLAYREEMSPIANGTGPWPAIINYNASTNTRVRATCLALIRHTFAGTPVDILRLNRIFSRDEIFDLLEYHPESERIIYSFNPLYILTIIMCSLPEYHDLRTTPMDLELRDMKLKIVDIVFPESPLVETVWLHEVELMSLRRDIDAVTSGFVNAVKDFLRTYGKSLALCSFCIGSMYYLKDPICKFLGFKPDELISSQFMGYDVKPNKSSTKKVVKLSSKNLGSKSVKPQSQVGMNVLAELQTSFRKRNVFSILREDPETDTYASIGFCIFIKDNVCLVPAHYIYSWKIEIEEDSNYSKRKLQFLDSENKFRITALIEECMNEIYLDDEMGGNDYLCMRVPGFTPVRDITKYILTTSEACDLPDSFPISFYDKSKNLFKESTAFTQKTHIEISINPEISYEVIRCLKYKVESSKGWCGLPIMACVKNQPKLVGFHIAGIARTETAYCSIINIESIDNCLVDQLFDTDLASETNFVEAQSGPSHLTSRFPLLGKALEGSHRSAGSTSIRRSPLQDVGFVPLTRPALLYPRGDIDPYEIALSHYGKHDQHSDYDSVNLAREDLVNFITFHSSDRERIVFPLEKALWGDPLDANFDSIKSSSSPGYPMKNNGDDLKKCLFSDISIRNSSNDRYPEVEERVNAVIENATLGVRMIWIFTDNLKDERRPIAKVLSGSTRLFNGCPLIYFIVFRMYFGAFAANCLDKKLSNNMALGVDPLSSEWNDIAQTLQTFQFMGDGDFSKFDASELSFFLWMLLDLINDWFDDGPINRRIRRILWMEVVNSRHIMEDLVYEWTGSLPSGHPLTSIINCLYNMFAFRYCYYRLVPSIHHFSFDTHVKLFVLGDDNIFSFSHLIKGWFNEQTIGPTMKELGLTFTPASKTSNDFLYRTLEELSFLKRGFYYEPLVSRYIGPLDRKSIDDIPLWTKKGSQRTQIFIDNVSEYLGELSLHPEADYIAGRNAIVEGIKKAGLIDFFPNLLISRKSSLMRKLTDIDM